MVIRNPEISAILPIHMQAQTRPDPITGSPGHPKIGNPGKVADHRCYKLVGSREAFHCDVIIDAVDVVAGEVSEDERAAFDGKPPG